LKEALYYEYIQIQVVDYFACTLYIGYGLNEYSIINYTETAPFNWTYNIPVLSSARQINTIYIVVLPDTTTNIEPAQFSINFRLLPTDPYNTSTI
jgi:hypothetical protein